MLAPFPGHRPQLDRLLQGETRRRSAGGTGTGRALLPAGQHAPGRRQFRISAQLVDSNSGTQLWAQRYDRDGGDFFAVQDEITTSIVQSIEPQLSRAEMRRALRKHPDNLDSWDYTQRALARLYGAFSHLHEYAGANAAEARTLLQKAIELDPSSSYAHTLLALSHFHDASPAGRKIRHGSWRRP